MREMKGTMTNLLKREDFINEQELKDKYADEIQPLKKYDEMIELKPLGDKERVKKFDEYIDD